MPPILSASFCCFASQRAAADEAPFSESAKTEDPLAFGEIQPSAWMLTKSFAPDF